MLSYQPAPAAPAAPPPDLETDPVKLIARAMIEMEAQGRVVDKPALVAQGFTRAEIDRHGEAAGDLALLIKRGKA